MFWTILVALTIVVGQLFACELTTNVTSAEVMVLKCEQKRGDGLHNILKLQISETSRHVKHTLFLADFFKKTVNLDESTRNFNVTRQDISVDHRDATVELTFDYEVGYNYYNFSCIVYGESGSPFESKTCTHYHDPSDYTTTTTTSTASATTATSAKTRTTSAATTKTTSTTTKATKQMMESLHSGIHDEGKGDTSGLLSDSKFLFILVGSIVGFLITIVISVLIVVRCRQKPQTLDKDLVEYIVTHLRQAGNRGSRFLSLMRNNRGGSLNSNYALPESTFSEPTHVRRTDRPHRDQNHHLQRNELRGGREPDGNVGVHRDVVNASLHDEVARRPPAATPPPPPLPCSRSQDRPNAGPPHLLQNTGSPHLSQNTGSPHLLQSTGSPHVLLNTGFPRLLQNTGSPHLLQNTGSHHLLQNAATPHLLQYTGSPHLLQNAATPHLLQNTGSPHLLQNTGLPHLLQNTGSPYLLLDTGSPHLLENTGSHHLLQNAATPHLLQNTGSHHLLQNAATPHLLQNTGSPQLLQNTASPYLLPDTGSPHVGQATGSPRLLQNTGSPHPLRNTGLHHRQLNAGSPHLPHATESPLAAVTSRGSRSQQEAASSRGLGETSGFCRPPLTTFTGLPDDADDDLPPPPASFFELSDSCA